MKFDLNECIAIIERTPLVLTSSLSGLSDSWLRQNEGGNTWSPYDILGHLIFGEKTDWMVRIKLILEQPEKTLFEPFDRFAQMNEDHSRSIDQLLSEFQMLRSANIIELKSLGIQDADLALSGIHPDFGKVTLKQLISTWTVHDLGHMAQISRVMASQYKDEVGPWKAYLRIVNQNQ